MSGIIEISELELNDSSSYSLPSSNFGGGLELLMNDKQKKSNKNSNVVLEDVEDIEMELNNLVNDTSDIQNNYNYSDNKVSFQNTNTNTNTNANTNNNTNDLGYQTAKQTPPTVHKTWDGFSSNISEVPFNPDVNVKVEPKLSNEEQYKQKLFYIRRLKKLNKDHDVECDKEFTMESSLSEIKAEYDAIMDEKKRINSVKFQGQMLKAAISGVEYLNSKFDPFDINLDGWSEQFDENIQEYDDIFIELYEKYKSKVKMEPEIRLMFQLGGSAAMVHMTNKLFKTSMPGMDDILRQNPDLARSFQAAAVNTMGQQNPGFGNFMGNIMNMNQQPQQQPQQPISPVPNYRQQSAFVNDNIHSYSVPVEKNHNIRPEMKGPSSDINDLLSGLKTKHINLHEKENVNNNNNNNNNNNINSTISISDLKELQSDDSLPRKSKRRSKSNTISLTL
jgi:hypothetical protein